MSKRLLAMALGLLSALAHAQSAWTVIDGVNTSGDYNLSGRHNMVLRNSHIGGVLRIDGDASVLIQPNTIRAIWIPGSNRTTNVTIDGNDIAGAANDCIDVNDGPVNPVNLVISHNRIHNCGTAWPNNPHFHAIYVQVPGVVIKGNTIWDAYASISMRSSGTVTGNTITQIPCAGGIEYFSDHDAAPGASLTIQGNVIISTLRNCTAGGSFYGSYRGLIVLGNGIGTAHIAVHHFSIADNYLKVLNLRQDPSGIYEDIYTAIPEPGARLVRNTLVNKIPGGQFIGPGAVGYESYDSKSH